MAEYPKGAEWWQYSDRARLPGLAGPVDASVFPGDLAHFLPTVRPGRPKAHCRPRRLNSPALVLGAQPRLERLEVFEEKASGEVVHRWQAKKDDGWVEAWQSLGRP